MNLDKRCINSGYVIAADPNDDSRMYSSKDPCAYYNSSLGWVDFPRAEVCNSEILCARLLDAAQVGIDNETTRMGYKPFAVYAETVISTVNTETFDAYLLQRKREKAMAKLTDEDLIVLGLVGDSK
jgi:hypothetical protein